MTKRCYVYQHASPSGAIFYIGRGTTQNRRGVRGPYQRAYDFRQRDEHWRAAAIGGVVVSIIAEFSDMDPAASLEATLVAEYGRRVDGGMLTNVCFGGRGAPGQPNTMNTRRKKSITKLAEKNPMYGRCGEKHPCRRPVVDAETGETYPTTTAAAKAIGTRMQTLHNMLTGFRPNSTNMRFA